MLRMLLGLVCTVATLGISGCGGATNSVPADAQTAEYAKSSSDKMKEMYGVPKATTAKAQSASDRMKSMYTPPRPGGAR